MFDLGNVMVGWDPFLPFSDRMSREQWDRFAVDADFFSLNAKADSGVPCEEIIALAAGKCQDHGGLMRQYYERFDRSLTGPVVGVADIVGELELGDLRLLGLTNWSTETFHHAPTSAPTIDRLEAIMVSGREGLAKPDPAIFHRLIERFALTPTQTVFIDDSPRNVRTAHELGFTALRFTDAVSLRAALEELHLLD
ncbi:MULTISPECIES: HAD-IA family hydrolase [Kocuria]|uniref:HAD-IA family hydrolase n=1 Tax=Kocuria TaxID=57493 RepID=UPI0025B76400|nr:HAD-IA family hydrolase [Kocuria rosea]WJZ66950.1 HAD-IA family hydrolase [Kocuria rosea]